MKVLRHTLVCMLGMMLCASFSACDGIFEGIYDEAVDNTEGSVSEGYIYADASSYTQWIYINLHTLTMDTVQIADDGTFTDPEEWDLALHRWDVRTNGGAGLETQYTSMAALQASGQMPEGDFVEDVWTTEQVVIDVTDMLSGILGYCESYYNPELSKMMDVDITNMPPTYTPSGLVYVLRLADGTYAALRLATYTNSYGIKGYLNIEYVYPLEF